MPEDDRWAAGIYGKVRDHSAALREGICETLVILSVHGNNLFKDRLGIDVDARAGRLIERLLTPLTLDKLMSHERDLPRYAEAAPETFLSLLEADLKKARAGCSRFAQTRQQRSLRKLPSDRPTLGARMPSMETADPTARDLNSGAALTDED